jgi:hypothetical protein
MLRDFQGYMLARIPDQQDGKQQAEHGVGNADKEGSGP